MEYQTSERNAGRPYLPLCGVSFFGLRLILQIVIVRREKDAPVPKTYILVSQPHPMLGQPSLYICVVLSIKVFDFLWPCRVQLLPQW